jgi:drug/metabolite transporter (DMT)-like permease
MEEGQGKEKFFLSGMVLSMLCWGISWVSGKVLSHYGDALNISFYRFFLTFISLYFILLFLKEKIWIKRNGILNLIGASFFISLYTYLFFKGLTLGKAGAGGVLVTILNPIISYGIMLIISKRKPTTNETIGLVLGLLAGIVLLKLTSNASEIFSAGNSYFLLASFCWSILTLFTAKASKYGSSVSFSFWMYGVSSLLMFMISDVQQNLTILKTGDLVFWGNLFYSATITTSMATTFFFVATSKIGASKASSFIFMVPFSAALGSWIILGEVPSLHTIIGGLLGIGAVYILNKKQKKSVVIVSEEVAEASKG